MPGIVGALALSDWPPSCLLDGGYSQSSTPAKRSGLPHFHIVTMMLWEHTVDGNPGCLLRRNRVRQWVSIFVGYPTLLTLKSLQRDLQTPHLARVFTHQHAGSGRAKPCTLVAHAEAHNDLARLADTHSCH